MRKLHNDGLRIDVDERLPALSAMLAAVPGLAAAYLIGSYGTPDQTPLSDVDFALLFRRGESPDFRSELRLRGDIVDILGEEDVSIVVLDRAPLAFQFRVLETGRRFVVNDPVSLADFVEATIDRYADFSFDEGRFFAEYDAALAERYDAA